MKTRENDTSNYEDFEDWWRNEGTYFTTGLGDTADPGASVVVTPGGSASADPWYATVLKTTLPVVATAYQQRQLTALNIARINNGLPPLTADQYAAVYQPPAAQVTVGPNSAAERAMWFFGVGGLGILAFMAWNRRQR